MSPAAGTGLAGELGFLRRDDRSAYDKEWRKRNLEKSNAYARDYYHRVTKKDPEKLKAKLKFGVWTRRKAKYGITKPEYEAMALNQKGRCAICKGKVGGALRVDHDHETGNVRELLCNQCNVGLGAFRENTETMTSAINYLKRHNANSQEGCK